MGLIYVNPEGPDGNPDPVASGRDIRETFARMAMNDEETVALVAGGHTFGKAHGAGDPDARRPRARRRADRADGPRLDQNAWNRARACDAITSGIEGAWKPKPTTWDMGYFDMLFGYEWELTKSPAGAHQWQREERRAGHMIPDAHDPSKKHPPMMTTADLSLRFDPVLREDLAPLPQGSAGLCGRVCARLVQADPPRHGPGARYLGPEVPAEDLIWQDPIPAVDHELVSDAGHRGSEGEDPWRRACRSPQLVNTAWASAATFRGSDKRGGANGARIRLAPQKDWAVNQPAELAKVLPELEGIQKAFNAAGGQRRSRWQT